MTNKGELNKWRLAQFRKNNEDSDDAEVDFVCLSPSKLDLGSQDPSTVFLSDSEDEKKKPDSSKKLDASVITFREDSPPLEVVTDISRLGRKRKLKENIVYAKVSSESDNDRDSDADFVVERPRRKTAVTKKPLKSLPLRPISRSRKTAVVVPITKNVTKHKSDALGPAVYEPKAGSSKQSSDTAELCDASANVDMKNNRKDEFNNHEDSLLSDQIEETKLEGTGEVKQLSDVDPISLTPIKKCPASDNDQYTPTTKIGKLDLLDDLLNSPIPRTPVKPMQNTVATATNIENVTPKSTKVVRPQNFQKMTEILNIQDSDSDVSLFEVSINEKTSTSKSVVRDAGKIPHNPPPSPIDISDTHKDSLQDMQEEPVTKPMQPMDNGFNSDSSTESGTENVVKRRRRKGKQPANKRKKVVAKRSRPLSEEEEEEEKNDSIQVVSPLKHMTESVVGGQSSKGRTTRRSARASNTEQADIEEVEASAAPQASRSGHSKSSNTAVVKPHDSVIVIQDDDEDDDIVMLTSNERHQQEEDDLEFARRLQAQFDQENAVRPGPLQFPSHAGSGSRSLDDSLSSYSAPLSDSSERLLQALGGSPAVTQLLGSPTTRALGEAGVELDQVQNRLELLQQLALEQDYIDDETISQILGMPETPTLHQARSSTSTRGPRPPGTTRPTNRGGARTRATSRRGRGTSRAENTASAQANRGYFERALNFLGLGDSDMDYESLLELSDRIGDVRQAGMDQTNIDRLPSRLYEEEATNSDNTCHICMSDFESGQRVRTLTCFHEYHSTCIDQWLQRNATCPVCRARVAVE